MKINILINDGLSKEGKQKLLDYNFNIIDKHIKQHKLINFINANNIAGILVRSATLIKKDIIDACSCLQLIGRGGVGMDNIDVEYARKKGIHVINTPSASSQSVAELVFSHLFSMVRYTFHSNRTMPLEGDTVFQKLKKTYSKGTELKGKTIGIIGFGKIGTEVAKIAIGIGMKVVFYDPYIKDKKIQLVFFNNTKVVIELKCEKLDNLIISSDVITVHIPKQTKPLIGKRELKKMKEGVFLINTSRGGVINEKDLIDSLNTQHVRSVGLDVFENEPQPNIKILMHDQVSLSPHIGASTIEAQSRIGLELAEQINNKFNGKN